MFFLARLMRSSNPMVRWGFAALLVAVGVGLIVWGLVGHDTYLTIRGVIELVIVAVVLSSIWRRHRSGRGRTTQ